MDHPHSLGSHRHSSPPSLFPPTPTPIVMSLPPTQKDIPCSSAAQAIQKNRQATHPWNSPIPSVWFPQTQSSAPHPWCQVPAPNSGGHPLLKCRLHQPEQQVGKLMQRLTAGPEATPATRTLGRTFACKPPPLFVPLPYQL